MIFKKVNIFFIFYFLKKIILQSTILILVSQLFIVLTFAETIKHPEKEANLVVKKNGRIFLINQKSKVNNFLNSPKTINKNKISKNIMHIIGKIPAKTQPGRKEDGQIKKTTSVKAISKEQNFSLRESDFYY